MNKNQQAKIVKEEYAKKREIFTHKYTKKLLLYQFSTPEFDKGLVEDVLNECGVAWDGK